MKNDFQQQYNGVIDLVGHLILTKPDAVIRLLAKYGVVFKGTPERKLLISEVVRMFHKGNQAFINDLSKIINLHIQAKGKEMVLLDIKAFNSFVGEDEFWGKLAKGALGIVGKIFKGKKKKRRSSSPKSVNKTASATAATQALLAQANQMRRDFERRIMEMEKQRKEEDRRRKEEAEKQRKEAEAKRKNTLMIGGVIVGFALVGTIIFVAGRKPQQPMMNYVPPQMMAR